MDHYSGGLLLFGDLGLERQYTYLYGHLLILGFRDLVCRNHWHIYPIFLHKRGVDPAIATGPFITTSNDIFGILIYFSIAKLILGI